MIAFSDANPFRDEIFALVRHNEFSAASRLCTEHLDIWPEENRHLLYGYRSYVRMQEGRYKDAYDDLTAALASNPTWPGHLYQRTRVALELDNLDGAVADATRLIEIEEAKGSAAFLREALLLRGLANVLLGRVEDCLRDAEKVRGDEQIRIKGRFWDAQEIVALARKKKS